MMAPGNICLNISWACSKLAGLAAARFSSSPMIQVASSMFLANSPPLRAMSWRELATPKVAFSSSTLRSTALYSPATRPPATRPAPRSDATFTTLVAIARVLPMIPRPMDWILFPASSRLSAKADMALDCLPAASICMIARTWYSMPPTDDTNTGYHVALATRRARKVLPAARARHHAPGPGPGHRPEGRQLAGRRQQSPARRGYRGAHGGAPRRCRSRHGSYTP